MIDFTSDGRVVEFDLDSYLLLQHEVEVVIPNQNLLTVLRGGGFFG